MLGRINTGLGPRSWGAVTSDSNNPSLHRGPWSQGHCVLHCKVSETPVFVLCLPLITCQESFFWPGPISSLEVVYKMMYFSVSPAALRCSLCKTSQACPFCHLYLWSSGPSSLGPCHWPGLNWRLGERVSMVVIYRWNEKNSQEGHLKKEVKKNW